MELFSDIFLGTAALAAAVYCLILSRKVSRLAGLDQDLGGAIAVLSQQVDEMTRALNEAKSASDASAMELAEIAQRAENASAKLELLIASSAISEPLDDYPVAEEEPVSDAPMFRSRTTADRNEASA